MREYTLTMKVTAPDTSTEAEVTNALNSALDEPPCAWGAWTVGTVAVTSVERVADEEDDEEAEPPVVAPSGFVVWAPVMSPDPTRPDCPRHSSGNSGDTCLCPEAEALDAEEESEDRRDGEAPGYDPRAALAECLDLWGSGAWPDENAVYNLEEVMEHVQRFLAAHPVG